MMCAKLDENLQTLLAMTHMIKKIPLCTEIPRFMVLSLGTGSAKIEKKFDAVESSKWGLFGWLHKKRSTPILDCFTQASADLVDIHASVLLKALRSEESYLRIQDDKLTGDTSSVDVSTKENLNRLVDVGNALLKKPVCKVNVEKGSNEPDVKRSGPNGIRTNEEELTCFAQMLVDERRARLNKKKASNTSQ
jgi:hypothetical protein